MPDTGFHQFGTQLRANWLATPNLLVVGNYLSSRQDGANRWDQILGSGERQRIAVARVLLHSPDVVVIDDSLSALEPEAQSALLNLIAAELPHAAVLTFGQRERSGGLRERRLTLETRSGGSILRASTALGVP